MFSNFAVSSNMTMPIGELLKTAVSLVLSNLIVGKNNTLFGRYHVLVGVCFCLIFCCYVGSESDFVILSTVRSRPSSAIEDQANVQWRRKFIGFVSDPHQINVAITRAKSGLCIVGKILPAKLHQYTLCNVYCIQCACFCYTMPLRLVGDYGSNWKCTLCFPSFPNRPVSWSIGRVRLWNVKSEVQTSIRSNRTQCCQQLATSATVVRKELGRPQSQ